VKVPLILGSPFLATSKSFIDVKDVRMALQVDEEEIVFKLRNSMRHTMDFDETCYFVDVVDDVVSEFVQETYMKDEHAELLGDDLPDDDVVEKVMEESHCLDLAAVEIFAPTWLPKKKTSRKTMCWRKVSTKRKKPLTSQPSPSVLNLPNSWTFGEISLINSSLPYSYGYFSGGLERSRFEEPP